jgi:hypothetical protein
MNKREAVTFKKIDNTKLNTLTSIKGNETHRKEHKVGAEHYLACNAISSSKKDGKEWFAQYKDTANDILVA